MNFRRCECPEASLAATVSELHHEGFWWYHLSRRVAGLLAVKMLTLCVNMWPHFFFFINRLNSVNLYSGPSAWGSIFRTRLLGLCGVKSYNNPHTVILTRQTCVCKLEPSVLHSIRVAISNSAFHLIQSTNSSLSRCRCHVICASDNEMWTLPLSSSPVITHDTYIDTDCYTALWLSMSSHLFSLKRAFQVQNTCTSILAVGIAQAVKFSFVLHYCLSSYLSFSWVIKMENEPSPRQFANECSHYIWPGVEPRLGLSTRIRSSGLQF